MDHSAEPELAVPEGAFLLSLDSELPQEATSIEHAILVQALFARRICLTDSQLIDSPGVQAFFAKNRRELQDEIDRFKNLPYPPMFGSCSRKGADIGAALDLMLTPNVRTGLPTYLSRLRPAENATLRKGFESLNTPEERRRRLYDLAGPSFQEHVTAVSRYFDQLPRSVVQGSGNPQATLFATVRQQLNTLREPPQRNRLHWIDHRICDALLKEMDTTSEGQTRERLHLAIYKGELPHYYRGRPQACADLNASKRHQWRHLINTFYNFNLAEKLATRPVLNSRWFEIPKRLAGPVQALKGSRLEKVGEVPLESAVYPEYLTVPFVVAVRSRSDFWKTLSALESASGSGRERVYQAAFTEHLRVVSQLFAEHLRDHGRGDLVKTSLADVCVKHIDPLVLYSAAVLASLAAWEGASPQEIAMVVAKTSLLVSGGLHLVVNGFIRTLPIKVKRPAFKSFATELGEVARQSRVLF